MARTGTRRLRGEFVAVALAIAGVAVWSHVVVSHPAPVTAVVAAKRTAPPDPKGWHLVWADEFDGVTLDRTKWAAEDRSTFGDSNLELACLMDRPENIEVANGVLALRAQREPGKVNCGTGDQRFPAGRAFSSAMISTKGLHDWVRGRFEIRAQLPTQPDTSKGLWPAFWLRPTDGGTGELDILEGLGSGQGDTEWNQVYQTLWYDYQRTHSQQSQSVTMPSGIPSDGMHTYAAEWDPGEIRWYVDGHVVYIRTLQSTPWLDEAFSKPFFIRLNLAVGGCWPGAPDRKTALPATYAIDYVRVYQR